MKPSNVDRLVFRIAGIFVLASLGLGYFVHPAWFLFTAFVGLNMFQASFTGFCPMAKILKKMGVKAGEAFCD
ncbi:MAG: sulfurtransferase [Candidatus Dadabacteria bacterium RIFCSPHIGHO2_12_FULL_53_21]|nr:MAG: sulfurtransferase [Candidatus Dadabacteria bacterium RIFCSPHIGHO2_12_FULL_53_21]